MQRFFLSGQTTCALLLGAGLLLRAQAALTRPESAPQARLETPRARPAELFGERGPRIPRALTERRSMGPAIAHAPGPMASVPAAVEQQQQVQNDSGVRKGLAHNGGRHKVRKCGGVALAGRQFRCG
ncbi:MAG TPA: hypothetical protein VH083_20860 [Myxococcales bacterium]|nr:hypothetical protein [Myxococcales bacterium]